MERYALINVTTERHMRVAEVDVPQPRQQFRRRAAQVGENARRPTAPAVQPVDQPVAVRANGKIVQPVGQRAFGLIRRVFAAMVVQALRTHVPSGHIAVQEQALTQQQMMRAPVQVLGAGGQCSQRLHEQWMAVVIAQQHVKLTRRAGRGQVREPRGRHVDRVGDARLPAPFEIKRVAVQHKGIGLSGRPVDSAQIAVGVGAIGQ